MIESDEVKEGGGREGRQSKVAMGMREDNVKREKKQQQQ